MARLEIEVSGSNSGFKSTIKDTMSALEDLKKFSEGIKIEMFGAQSGAELKAMETNLASISKVMKTFESDAKLGANAINSNLTTAINGLKVSEQELKNEYQKNRAELAKYSLEQRKLADVQKAEAATVRASEKAHRDLLAERRRGESEARKLAATIARNRKQVEKESSEYYKLSTTLGKLRKEAKDVLAEMFRLEAQGKKGSAAYQQLADRARAVTAQTKHLDAGLKKIDSSLGLHQRNVGNYSSALGALSPQFSRLTSQMQMMGVDIEAMGKGGASAFAGLGASIASVGRNIGAFLLSPVGLAITAIGAVIGLFRSGAPIVKEFNAGLLNVSKTTGISGIELDQLSDSIIGLSRSLKTVSTNKLLEYATVAGQLGVKGSKNIMNFAEALAMLETASDITGESGGAEIARLLTLTDGGVQNIKSFGDEIVNLGNNFAATEKEILGNAQSIAQNTGLYKVGRQDVLAYAVATKSVGLEAEVVGSAFFRTLAQLEKYSNGAKGAEGVLKLLGVTQKQLSDQFKSDSSTVFKNLIGALNGVDKAGGSVTETLKTLGLNNVRDIRVLGTLASSGYGQLEDAMITVTDAAGAMQREFETQAGSLVNQTGRIGIAWDNLVLTVENGTGVIGRSSVAVVGFFADMLEAATELGGSTSLKEFFTRLTGYSALGNKALAKARGDLVKFDEDQKRLAKSDPFAFKLGNFERAPRGVQTITLKQNKELLETLKEKAKLENDSSKKTIANISQQIQLVKDMQDHYDSLNKTKAVQGEVDTSIKEATGAEIKAREAAAKRIEQVVNDSNNRILMAGKENRDRELAQVDIYYNERLKQVQGNASATAQLLKNKGIEQTAINEKYNQQEIDAREKVEAEIDAILQRSVIEKVRSRDQELALNDAKYNELEVKYRDHADELNKIQQARDNEAAQISAKHDEIEFQAMARFITKSNRNREQALIEQLELEYRLELAGVTKTQEEKNAIYAEFAERRKAIIAETAQRNIVANNDNSPLYMELAQAELKLDELKEKFNQGLISPEAFEADRMRLQSVIDGLDFAKNATQELEKAVASSFMAILSGGESAAEGIKNAFKGMANAIIAELMRIAAAKLVADIFSGGLFGGVGKVLGFSSGGYTGNVGTNKVAGVVHGQEFVFDAATTRKHRPLFEAIQSGKATSPTVNSITKGGGNNEMTVKVQVEGEISGNNIRLAEKRTNQKFSRFYSE